MLFPDAVLAQPPYPAPSDTANWISAPLNPNANYWEIKQAAEEYFSLYPDHPDIKQFGRWMYFWESRVGDQNNPGSFQPALEGWANLTQNCYGEPAYCQGDQIQAQWQALGPYNEDSFITSIGRVQSIAVDPRSPSRVYAGSASGGLYRTEDIQLAHPTWECLTCGSNLPMVGVFSIAIDPVIEETPPIYIAAGFDIATFFNFGAGFYRSLDDGQTWEKLSQPGELDPYRTITFSIVHHPKQSQVLFAAAHNRIYKTINGGGSWTEVLAPYESEPLPPVFDYSRYHLMRDIVFHPVNPDIMFVSSDDQDIKDEGAELFISQDGGATWSEGLNPYTLGLVGNWVSRMDIAISSAAPDTVFVSCVVGDGTSGELLKYNHTNGTWHNPGGGTYSASWNMNDIIVDPLTTQNIYVGHVDIWESVNYGKEFDFLSNGVHDDNRDLEIVLLITGDVQILSGNDGGVGRFVTGGVDWENKNGSGLNIAQFYGMGASLDGGILTGGCQDVCILELKGGTWTNPNEAPDGGAGFVDPYEPLYRYVETWSGTSSGPSNGLLRATPSSNYTSYYDNIINIGAANRGAEVRPLAMDTRRRLYIGHKQVFRRSHEEAGGTSTSWEQVGAIGTSPHIRINALALAPSDERVIFAGRGPSGVVTGGNILVHWNMEHPDSNWRKVEIENISDTILFGNAGGGAVRDIVVDPGNPNRIWFCTDRFVRNYKVVMLEYNPENGKWWATNVSEGLCDYPVHTLAYHVGSNHAMYAGTEIGVFFNPDVSDPNSSWVCFNDDMPPCVVTDLTINYCGGTLTAATFGCGAWISPLAEVPVPHSLIVSEDATWDYPRLILSDLEIMAGTTLKVTSSIFMGNNRKIIIRPGGRMIVEGGTLSTLCDDYWYGIYVEGQYDQPQTGTQVGGPQGVLILKGALVEKAWSAVNLQGAPGSGDPFKLTGGVVQASLLIQNQDKIKTVFRNNARDFHTYPYSYSFPPPLQGQPYNLSRFVDCVFETTDAFNILASEIPQEYTHANLFGVKGISFTACTFEDARTQPSPQMAGFTGITSNNSQFIVQGRCNPAGQPCETWDPTVFKNLHRAVNAGNFGEVHPFTVDRCSFVNNHFGVQSWAVDYLTVTRNRFEGAGSPVVTLLPYEHEPRSITIYGGTEYTVEENTLLAPSGVPTPFDNLMGIVVIETGEDFNTIYKNELSNLTLGNLALGWNRSEVPYKGLAYDCNKNTGNRYDFMVPDPSGPYSEAGIRQNQGSAQTSAGNKFSPMPPLPESHFFNTASSPVTYFYKEGEPGDEPVNYSVGVDPQEAGVGNTCLSRFDQGPVIPADPIPHKVRFFERSVRLDSLKNALGAKIDGGASPSLLQAISASTAADSQAVRAQLIQLSPYVSQAALEEYLGREELFSEAQMAEVLALNPDILRLPAFWDAAQDVLSPTALAQLESARQMRTPRTDAEAAIAEVAAERAYAARRVVHYYLGDTLASQADSARHWIALIETLQHQYVLAGGYLQASDTVQAAMILNAIPAGFSLTPAQWAAHADYEALLDIRKGMVAHEDWISYIQEHENGLKNLAEQGVSRAAVQAQFLYNVVFGPTYQPPVSWTGGGSQAAEKAVPPAAQEWPREVSGDLKLAVIPNPARESVQFHYEIPGVEKGAQLRVFDPSGRIIRTWDLGSESGVIVWQINGEAPKGIYLASLVAGGKAPVTIRFSVVE